MLQRLRKLIGFERKGGVGLTDPEALWLFGALPTTSGVSVTGRSAVRVPAVAAAVSLISNSVATLPAKTFVSEGETKAADPAHPSYSLIHDRASPWVSAAEFRRLLTIDALTHPAPCGAGRGYALAVRVNGRVRELHRLDPNSVRVECADDGSPVYMINLASGGTITRDWRDVLVIDAPGGCPVHHAREAIALALVLEAHAARLFANGGRPSGVLKFPGTLTPESTQRIKASWQNAHAGSSSGGTAVLESGGDFIPLAFTSVDAEFMAQRQFQIVEIARAFGVPVSMIGDLSRATWSNSLEQRQQFLMFSLLPWLRAWEAAYTRVLVADNELDTHSIEFITDDFLRADTASRAEAYSKFRAAGVYTSNELRRLENLPPLPGGDKLDSPHVQSPTKAAA